MSIVQTAVAENLADYIRRVTLREPEVLKRLREETAKLPNAMMQICPEQGQFMGLLMRLLGATRTLEIGVFTGYSSTVVARALPQDGKIIACYVSAEYTAMARRYWREAGVEHKVGSRLAPAIATMDAQLSDGKSGSLDFAFIGADKENY